MIAADTSAWVDYAKGVESDEARRLEACLSEGTLVIPSPVLFEILSGPGLTDEARRSIQDLPRLDISQGYWERAAALRRAVMKRGLKARAMDCLIAQNCIDHHAGLITSDQDFRRLVAGGLRPC